MRMRWFLFPTLILALAAAACSVPEPYIYTAGEYDRTRPDFGREPTDRETVAICYNKRNATPAQILQMAQTECAKFQKVARLSGQGRLDCPITTPIRAVFACLPSPTAFPR